MHHLIDTLETRQPALIRWYLFSVLSPIFRRTVLVTAGWYCIVCAVANYVGPRSACRKGKCGRREQNRLLSRNPH